jgi:phosphonoacetaldehyde dehydrogenase
MNDRAASQRVIEVRYPFDNQVVGTVPKATVDEVRAAFAAARAYRSKLTRFQRASIMQKAAELLRGRVDAASDLITKESGLSKKDSIYEVGRVCDVLTFAAMETLKDDGQSFSCDLTPHGKNRRVYTRREPLLGAICAITPFNHPMNQVAHKVAPAIATNNRMVLKPSEKTPLSAYYLAELLYEAGLPREMFRVVTGARSPTSSSPTSTSTS